MTAPKRRATYEDIMALPEHQVGEIIDGELFVSPRPAIPHARASTRIGVDLGPFDGQPGAPGRIGGWWILFEVELHLGADVLVPDVAGWRRERMPALPAEAHLTLAPDWVCEVLSPRTSALDRSRKMAVYAREGVSHLWYVDPIARTLEVYRLEAGRWLVVGVHADAEHVAAEPFGELAIDIAEWWTLSSPPA